MTHKSNDKLLQRIAKLERLASERNPNEHERAAARAKALQLRKQQLGHSRPTQPLGDGLLSRAQVVKILGNDIHLLKHAFQKMRASELCMAYLLGKELDSIQWQFLRECVIEINEAKGT